MKAKVLLATDHVEMGRIWSYALEQRGILSFAVASRDAGRSAVGRILARPGNHRCVYSQTGCLCSLPTLAHPGCESASAAVWQGR